MTISRDSAKLIEGKGAARAWKIFQARHNDLIRRAQVRAEYVTEQRRRMIEAMTARICRTVIAHDILESLECKKKRKTHKHERGDVQGGREDTGCRRGLAVREMKFHLHDSAQRKTSYSFNKIKEAIV